MEKTEKIKVTDNFCSTNEQFETFRDFAKKILKVPKSEVDELEKAKSNKKPRPQTEKR